MNIRSVDNGEEFNQTKRTFEKQLISENPYLSKKKKGKKFFTVFFLFSHPNTIIIVAAYVIATSNHVITVLCSFKCPKLPIG